MGYSSRFYTASDNFRTMEQWLNILNQQATASVTPGAKAQRATFGGSLTQVGLSSKGLTQQFAEGRMQVSSNYDLSQGQVTSSYVNTHLAVRGEGFFAIAENLNAGTKVIYTRDGEFHKDLNGLFRDRFGNYLLSAEDINPAANTIAVTGGVGVKESNFYGPSVAGAWQDPMTGGGSPVITTTWNENFDAVNVTAGLPSAAAWKADAQVVGFNDTAFGGPNASTRSVGWDDSAFGANGAGKGLYYGDQTSGTNYATGIEGAKTLDIMTNWGSAPLTDVDMTITEAGGGTVNGGSPLGQGWSIRDQVNGLRPGGGTYSDWDEYYHLDLKRPTGFTPGIPTYNAPYDDYTNGTANYGGVNSNDGRYRVDVTEFSGNGATVNWQVVEDATGARTTTTSGSTALGANGTANIGAFVKADRSNKGNVYSPEYNLAGSYAIGTVQWDQKSMVEAGALLDTMSFSYRLDGGAWVTVPVDVKTLTANNGNWSTITPVNLSGLTGANKIQFRWSFDTIDSKQNNTFGWAIDNFKLTAQGPAAIPSQLRFTVKDLNSIIPPGAVIELLDSGGNLQGSVACPSSVPGVAITIPVTDLPFPDTKWPMTNATVRIRAGATIIDQHIYSSVNANDNGLVTLSGRRGFEAAIFTGGASRLQASSMGIDYLEAIKSTDVPFLTPWGTQGAGKIVRNALEDSNSPAQKIGVELNMAKAMWGNLTKVVQARTMNLDSLLSIVK
jgi:flagellar basal body rod protein FlgG